MPKKRKTRKQKLLTDQKKHVINEEPLRVSSQNMETQSAKQETVLPGMTFSLPTQHVKTTSEKRFSSHVAAISTSEYGYLGKDLMRTMLLTGAIVLAELLIKVLFKG